MSVTRPLLGLFLGFACGAIAQQNLPLPVASPLAEVKQTVGVSEISVWYHRPGVKGRAIWGALVPYNEIWRAGANENTTITFSDPVSVEGKNLPAGRYGLHMVPRKDEWTIVFSTNSTSWGSYNYDEKEDALRVNVKPRPSPFQEWLSYQVDDLGTGSAVVSLQWEKLEIPFRVEFNVPEVIVRKAREEYLRGPAQFTWQGWYQAASYCAITGTNLSEANRWIDRSIRMNKNFSNVWVKRDLLGLAGKKEEAKKVETEALALGNEAAINTLGYQYLGNGRVDAAIELFKINVDKYPDSWNVYDSLAEGYATKGEKRLAVDFYSKALAKTTDEAQKTRIRQALATLGE